MVRLSSTRRGWLRDWILADDINHAKIINREILMQACQKETHFNVDQLSDVQSVLRGGISQLRVGGKEAHWNVAKFEW